MKLSPLLGVSTSPVLVKFLFWNTNRKPLLDSICAIVEEHDLDVVILAEYYPTMNESDYSARLCSALNASRRSQSEDFRAATTNFRRSPVVLSRLGDSLIGKAIHYKVGVYSLFTSPGSDPLLIATLHLPSKLQRTDGKQASDIREHMDALYEALDNLGTKLKSSKQLLVGDFNLNPFDSELIDRDRLNTFPTVELSATRLCQDPRSGKRDHKTLGRYNPSWALFGDLSSPGTYYYRDHGHEWHVYDQIILSNEAASFYEAGSLRVIKDCVGHHFLKSGIPDKEQYSDHLPMIF